MRMERGWQGAVVRTQHMTVILQRTREEVCDQGTEKSGDTAHYHDCTHPTAGFDPQEAGRAHDSPHLNMHKRNTSKENQAPGRRQKHWNNSPQAHNATGTQRHRAHSATGHTAPQGTWYSSLIYLARCSGDAMACSPNLWAKASKIEGTGWVHQVTIVLTLPAYRCVASRHFKNVDAQCGHFISIPTTILPKR
jgi:hypothetical protein